MPPHENFLEIVAMTAESWSGHWKADAMSRQEIAGEIRRLRDFRNARRGYDVSLWRLAMKTALRIVQANGSLPPNPRRT